MALNNIMKMFDTLESEIKRGGNSGKTEPYMAFEDTLNGMYDYVKDVFKTNAQNKKEYEKHLHDMEKECNCADKYKADKEIDYSASQSTSQPTSQPTSQYIIHYLRTDTREEPEFIVKDNVEIK
jgi:hypothetical protein